MNQGGGDSKNSRNIRWKDVFHKKEKLGLSKLCASWVPKTLRPDQKADCNMEFSNKFDANLDGFMTRVVTGDGIWILILIL